MPVRDRIAADDPEWLRLRRALWPDLGERAQLADMAAWLARGDAVVLVAPRPAGGLQGFAEVGARSVADGCSSEPVAYLEGWYVDRDARRSGVGTALVRAAERWARTHGYLELASDAEIANRGSQKAHLALGFTEVSRVVSYFKKLSPARSTTSARRGRRQTGP